MALSRLPTLRTAQVCPRKCMQVLRSSYSFASSSTRCSASVGAGPSSFRSTIARNLERASLGSCRGPSAVPSSGLRRGRSADPRGKTTARAQSAAAESGGVRSVVFLGTPEAAAVVLRELLLAAEKSREGGGDGVAFEVSAVVTRPSKRKTHGKTLEGSPVASVAAELRLDESVILSPESAKDEAFLATMRDLRPDLCVTAAYGNILPQAFLDIPVHGTVNIHPSELPRFRGPAPVQRAMLEGHRNLCVSLAFTVLKMDAGKVIEQRWLSIDKNETSDSALAKLFEMGSAILVDSLPSLLTGRAEVGAWAQDEAMATHAPKLAKEEGVLAPHDMTAAQCHDTACALNIWPGTSAEFTCITPISKSPGKKKKKQQQEEAEEEGSVSIAEEEEAPKMKEETFSMKISRTQVEEDLTQWDAQAFPLQVGSVQMCKGRKATDMLVVCKDRTLLKVGSVQMPGKKTMEPRAFFNGRKGATLRAKDSHIKVDFNPEILSKIAKADIGRGLNLN